MATITLDNYYNVGFYNECLEALKNNSVDFEQYISTKPPYQFYLVVENEPTFVNYDKVSPTYNRHLVNVITALKPNDDYIYQRRDTYQNKKAIQHYAINDALQTGQDAGEGVFFHAEKEEILRISKEFPRRIFFMGRYYNRKYKVFFSDSLLVKNFLKPSQILVQDKGFKMVTELEAELNWNVFKQQDRLIKLSETPYVQNGRFYPIPSVRPEISDKYVLS